MADDTTKSRSRTLTTARGTAHSLRLAVVSMTTCPVTTFPPATPESDIDVPSAFDVNLESNVFIAPTVVTPAMLNHPVWRETPFIETVLRESRSLWRLIRACEEVVSARARGE